jgi:type VI secretion system ImpM family protein
MPDEYVIGYYGKLPISREFLRWNGAGVEMRELDQWLQEGMLFAKARLGDGWVEALEKAEIWNFLFVPLRGTRLLLGTILPSSDQIGRGYPFLAFTLIDQEKAPIRRALLPLAFKAFLRQTGKLVGHLRSTKDWGAFRDEFESLNRTSHSAPSEVQAFYDEHLGSVTAADFWAGLSGGAAGRPTVGSFSPVLFERVGQRAGPQAHQSSAFKFPLVKDVNDETYDMPFWMDLTSSVRTDLGDPRIVFWSRGDGSLGHCMLVGFGTPSPKMVQFLLTPQADSPDWSDPFSPFSSMAHDSRMAGHDPREIACDPRTSLKATLQEIRSSTSANRSSGSV